MLVSLQNVIWLVHPIVEKFPFREPNLCRSQNIPMGQESSILRKEYPTVLKTVMWVSCGVCLRLIRAIYWKYQTVPLKTEEWAQEPFGEWERRSKWKLQESPNPEIKASKVLSTHENNPEGALEESKTKKYQGPNNFVGEEERFESLQQPFFRSTHSTSTGFATLGGVLPHQNMLLACIPNRLGSKIATKTVIFLSGPYGWKTTRK